MKKTYRDDFFQEIFDKVAKHLLTQNERAVNASGRCKYRINGLKCAAGILISDSDYLPEMEENIALTLKYFPESGYSKEEIALIHQLQLLHDGNEPKTWMKLLKELAVRLGLQFKQ